MLCLLTFGIGFKTDQFVFCQSLQLSGDSLGAQLGHPCEQVDWDDFVVAGAHFHAQKKAEILLRQVTKVRGVKFHGRIFKNQGWECACMNSWRKR